MSARLTDEQTVPVMRAAGVEPLEPYPGSLAKWRCRCLSCGREVSPRHNSIQQGQGGCNYCAGHMADRADAVDDMRAAGLDPLEPFESTKKNWRCRCTTCDRIVTPKLNNIRSGWGGCRYCAVGRIDYTAPGLVYLLDRNGSFLKIGITTATAVTDRIAQHVKNGWTVIRTWNVATADVAEDIENGVLDWWRDELEAPDAVAPEDMPQGGWTETASLVLVDVDETVARIDAAVDIVNSA